MAMTASRGRPLSVDGELDRASEQLLEARGALAMMVKGLAGAAMCLRRADGHLRSLRAKVRR